MKKSRWIGLGVVLAVVAYLGIATKLENARIAPPLPGAVKAGRDIPDLDVAMALDDLKTLASAEFGGRKTGTEGSKKTQDLLVDRFQSLGLQAFGKSYLQTFNFTHTSIKGLLMPGRAFRTDYAGINVLGYFPGTKDPQRYIVISAHYDHLGTRDGKLHPGADDNASGVAALLALANYYRTHPPLHTVVFAAFDGEEMGLKGAYAFVAALPFAKDKLAFNLNMDMVSHNAKDEIFASGSGHTPALRPLLEQAAKRSTLKVLLGHDRSMLLAGLVEDWTGASDHCAFHAAGVPYLYFGVEDHADYHAPTDTFERINPAFFAKVLPLVADVAGIVDRNLDALIDAKTVLK